MKYVLLFCLGLIFNFPLYAAPNLTGFWQQIDDITGTPRSIIEIFKEYDGSYAGKLIKINTRGSYLPLKHCHNCPAPYTNQPIIGLKLMTQLKSKKPLHYDSGKVLDPMTGRLYDAYIKIEPNGAALTLHTYRGFAFLGRSQTWLRIHKNAT